MFLQVHTLTSFAAALLNRDDAGLAKRIPFGNAERMRVSSQCLKKHWRDELHRSVSLPKGIRSRRFFEREVLKRLLEGGVPEEKARPMVESLIKDLIQGKKDETNSLLLKQPVLFGKPEADYLVDLVTQCIKDGEDPMKILKAKLKEHKGNLRALLSAAGHSDLSVGLEGALFGRFVTSDILARSDAAVHVAHAFTVHPIQTEVDYFTVVDDLKEEMEHAGAAHAGDMELGAGLFYGYVVVDIPLLISNLCGCDRKEWQRQPVETVNDAKDILTNLIQIIATVSPGAKLGATAPYSRAAFVLLETGAAQPRTLANAFLEALRVKGDAMQQAVDMLGKHLSALDRMYGKEEERFISSIASTGTFPDLEPAPLRDTVQAGLSTIFGGN